MRHWPGDGAVALSLGEVALRVNQGVELTTREGLERAQPRNPMDSPISGLSLEDLVG